MSLIRLGSRAYRTLQEIIHSSSNGREVRRAQALVWLHENESVAAVAARLPLSRQAVYDIVDRFQGRSDLPVAKRTADRRHSGRPATKRQRTQEVLRTLLKLPPSHFGYRSPVWTVPLLRRQVEKRLRQPISTDTVRRALHQMRYRYKRPRLVLAQRSPHWHQVKGGSKQASRKANDESSCSWIRRFSLRSRRYAPCGRPWANKPACQF